MHNWKIEEQKLRDAIAANISIASTIRHLGLSVGGANYKMVKSKIKQLGIATPHWLGQASRKDTTHTQNPQRPLIEILIENSTYLSTSSLKQRLLKEKLLNYKCSECGLMAWRNRPISLQLEHKNGINDDNRLENLTLLCPNCHSQTPTFAGRKLKFPDNLCPHCKTKIQLKSKTCGPCRIKWSGL